MFSSRFRATGVAEAEAHLRARYGVLELTDARLRFDERVRADDEFALVEHDYEGVVAIGGEFDVISISLPYRAEGFAWRAGGERGRGIGQPVLFQPGQRFSMNVDHASLRTIVFDRAALARDASALYAVDSARVDFASARPRSPAAGRLWASVVDVAAERDDLDYALLHASVRSRLTRLLFEAFPLLDKPIERRASAAARWFGYRRAVDFIHGNASLPITITDIATAAGLSRRELDAAFRSHTRAGLSALGLLRRVRLEAARDELRDTDPAVDAVGEVARRWGFLSRGRFVRHYRDAFGVGPHEERRRAS